MAHNHRAHFGEKEAIAHVAEKHAQGIFERTEVHSTEMPGHFSAATDAAKETAIILVTVWILLAYLHLPSWQMMELCAILTTAWLVWKSGRSAWLGWARLERLHRVLLEEKWEIEHHRPQEREELIVLYTAKGFEGKLLDDVVDTLMADGDRLLKVMIEEEMGLSLENQEHPIKQALGAATGTLLSASLCALGYFLYPTWGIFPASLFAIAAASALSAQYERNHIASAVVWNLGIAILVFGTADCLIRFFE